jgi:hypothetical protein
LDVWVGAVFYGDLGWLVSVSFAVWEGNVSIDAVRTLKSPLRTTARMVFGGMMADSISCSVDSSCWLIGTRRRSQSSVSSLLSILPRVSRLLNTSERMRKTACRSIDNVPRMVSHTPAADMPAMHQKCPDNRGVVSQLLRPANGILYHQSHTELYHEIMLP